MLKGFREFILRGNLIELAVAFVIGLAFAQVIQTFVSAVVKPIINAFPGASTHGWGFSLRGGDLAASTFIDISTLINSLIVFLLTAVAVYFVLVLPLQKWNEMRGIPPAEAAKTPEEHLLEEIRDLLAAQRA